MAAAVGQAWIVFEAVSLVSSIFYRRFHEIE
jgi:hypothetical protein